MDEDIDRNCMVILCNYEHCGRDVFQHLVDDLLLGLK